MEIFQLLNDYISISMYNKWWIMNSKWWIINGGECDKYDECGGEYGEGWNISDFSIICFWY